MEGNSLPVAVACKLAMFTGALSLSNMFASAMQCTQSCLAICTQPCFMLHA